jgi:hypothetical protein
VIRIVHSGKMPDNVGNVNVVAVDDVEELRVGNAIQIGDGGEDDNGIKEDVSVSRPPAARSPQSGRQQATCGRKKPAGSGPGRPERGQGQMANGSPARGQRMAGAPDKIKVIL